MVHIWKVRGQDSLLFCSFSMAQWLWFQLPEVDGILKFQISGLTKSYLPVRDFIGSLRWLWVYVHSVATNYYLFICLSLNKAIDSKWWPLLSEPLSAEYVSYQNFCLWPSQAFFNDSFACHNLFNSMKYMCWRDAYRSLVALWVNLASSRGIVFVQNVAAAATKSSKKSSSIEWYVFLKWTMSDMEGTVGTLGWVNVVGSVPECLTSKDEARFSQTLGLSARMLMVNLED